MGLSLHDQLALAHAVFACIAVLFTLPIALLAGRYLRSAANPNSWYRIHVIFNTITVLLIILVFGLGMGAVSSAHLGTQFNGPNSDLHHKIGLCIFIIVLVQAILGILSHGTRPKHPLRRVHVPFGIIVAAGMYWETWEGMHDEWAQMSTTLSVTPQSVQVLFWVLFLISATVYGIAVGQTALNKVAGSKEVTQVERGRGEYRDEKKEAVEII